MLFSVTVSDASLLTLGEPHLESIAHSVSPPTYAAQASLYPLIHGPPLPCFYNDDGTATTLEYHVPAVS